MFPVHKNVRRLLLLRSALYVIYAIVGLAVREKRGQSPFLGPR